MAWISYKFDEIDIKTGLILLLFLPQLLLALITTINKSNVKILIQHPSLVLLPVFTFFTFSKKKITYFAQGDSRVQFSKFYSLVNISLTTVCIVPVVYFCIFEATSSTEQSVFEIAIAIFLFGSGIIFTFLFLYIENLPCCNQSKIVISTFDPNQ